MMLEHNSSRMELFWLIVFLVVLIEYHTCIKSVFSLQYMGN